MHERVVSVDLGMRKALSKYSWGIVFILPFLNLLVGFIFDNVMTAMFGSLLPKELTSFLDKQPLWAASFWLAFGYIIWASLKLWEQSRTLRPKLRADCQLYRFSKYEKQWGGDPSAICVTLRLILHADVPVRKCMAHIFQIVDWEGKKLLKETEVIDLPFLDGEREKDIKAGISETLTLLNTNLLTLIQPPIENNCPVAHDEFVMFFAVPETYLVDVRIGGFGQDGVHIPAQTIRLAFKKTAEWQDEELSCRVVNI